MGFVMPHIAVVIGTGAVGLALILQIVGMATPGWIVFSTKYIRVGLWKVCVSLTCGDSSDFFFHLQGTVPDWLKACRAFGILGMLAMAASLACALRIFFMNEQKIFSLLAPLAAAVGAFCAMIEFAVWAGEVSSALSDYFGYSFALTIVACLLSAAAAGLFLLGRNKGGA